MSGPLRQAVVAPGPRHVDPHAPLGPVRGLCLRLACSRPAVRLATTRIWSALVWRVDPWLMSISGGRLGSGLLFPTAMLQTRGARTGRMRRNAVIYFHDGERVTIVASKAGRPGDPAWLHNALANPSVELGKVPFRARIVEDEAERRRLWALADNVFPAFAAYRSSAGEDGRTIAILQLTPLESS